MEAVVVTDALKPSVRRVGLVTVLIDEQVFKNTSFINIQ